MANKDETVAMIVRKEVRLAEERGYCPLNDDDRYEQALSPIVAALVDHVTLPSKVLADRFCSKIRTAERAREKRDDLLPASFVESMQQAGFLCETDDAVAATLLMKEFAALAPGEIPATEGERHFFDTEAQVADFFERFERWETHELVTRLSTDHKFCVDVKELW
jgi:hypothetical protein